MPEPGAARVAPRCRFAAAMLAAAFLLAGCERIETVHRDVCESVVPVLEPAGTRVTILEVAADPRREGNIRIRYRADRPDPDGGTPDPAERSVACAFGGIGFESGKAVLIGVETLEGRLSETRLHLLRRHWLSDPAAIRDAMRAVDYGPDARRKGFAEVDRDTGYFLQQHVNAAAPGALYALLAVAYSLVYGLTGRINFAFGDFAMIGAYAGLIGVGGAIVAGFGAAGLALPLALLFAVSVSVEWSRFLGRHVFLPLLGRGAQPVLVATIGLSIALQEFVGRVQGVRERWLPPILAEPHLLFHGDFDVTVTTMQLLVIAASLVCASLTVLLMRASRFGRDWRAVADDAVMARMLGVDPGAVLVATFALSGVLTALAGTILTTHYGGTSFHMGTIIGLKALVAAIVGGIGSLPGALLGGVLIGLAETFWSAYAEIVWRDAVIFALMAVFLVLKPEGLLGTPPAVEEKDRVG